MRIQLFDRGTPKGKQLLDNLDEVCQRMQLDCAPEFIKDMNRPYSMGVQGTTILMIDGEVALVDKYPSKSELENLISDFVK